MKAAWIIILVFVSAASAQVAKQARPVEDPQIEQRMQALTQQLRCLVCQNETLAASRADLAEDLRREIRAKMREGLSDQQIVDYLVERYGDFVLYNPAVKPKTAMLWFGPFVLLAGGIAFSLYYLKRRRSRIVEKPLSEAEQKRVAALLSEGENK